MFEGSCKPSEEFLYAWQRYDQALKETKAGEFGIEDIIPRCQPHLSEEPDWTTVLYPNPPSHDFCSFLVAAELSRREHECDEPLKVVFLLHEGRLGFRDWGNVSISMQGAGGICNVTREHSNQIIAHVMRPAIDMIGAINLPDLHMPIKVEDVKHMCEYTYFIYQLVDASRLGFKIPKFKPPEWARETVKEFLQGEKPVVITLRETGVDAFRNSNIEAWVKFAVEIKGKHPVIILRDTVAANLQSWGFRTWPMASTDAKIRAALYEAAYCNLMIGNGPCAWCTFTDAPYLIFKQLIPGAPPEWLQATEKGWWIYDRLLVGQQFPWADERQRLTWCDDTFENIIGEFEKFDEQTNVSRRVVAEPV